MYQKLKLKLPNTGLIFLALEQEKMQTYFIPELGPAPRWCSFLDNLVEDMEENETDTIYDDYKFVTVEEVTKLIKAVYYDSAQKTIAGFTYRYEFTSSLHAWLLHR